MKILSLCFALALLCAGCRVRNVNGGSHSHGISNDPALPVLTESQQKWLKKYDRFRGHILNYFNLPSDASLEELRPHLARALGFSAEATWEELLQSPMITNELTEGKRMAIARDFGLSESASWFEIRDALEAARAQN